MADEDAMALTSSDWKGRSFNISVSRIIAPPIKLRGQGLPSVRPRRHTDTASCDARRSNRGRCSPSCSHRHREPDRDQVEHHRESEAMKPDAYGGRQGIAHAIEPVAITISAGSAAS